MPDVTGHTPSKKFNFCLISPQNICPNVLGIIKIFFGKCETSPWVIFGQQCLLSWNSPMDAVFAQSLSYCWTMNTDLNWGKWGLQFFRWCSGFFMTSLMSRHCALGVILVGRPLLGRFTTFPSFLHLWIMALTMVRWSLKALEIALQPFPDWYYFVSQGRFWQLFSLNKLNHTLKTAFCIYSHYICVILKCVCVCAYKKYKKCQTFQLYYVNVL